MKPAATAHLFIKLQDENMSKMPAQMNLDCDSIQSSGVIQWLAAIATVSLTDRGILNY